MTNKPPITVDFPGVQPEPLVHVPETPGRLWTAWTGEGPEPKKWTAINPDTKESVVVYRSYEDYCND